jgi:hypothetical protein
LRSDCAPPGVIPQRPRAAGAREPRSEDNKFGSVCKSERVELTEWKVITTSPAIAKLNSKGAAAMSHTLIDFQEHIDPASTAEWRWEKAAQFPGDARNEKAAKELERIAGEFELLKGSKIHQQIDEACQLLNNLMDN